MSSLPRTLHASWFCSKAIYELERQAVFLTAWHLLGPVTRFQVREVEVQYEIAQVTICVKNTAPLSDSVNIDGIVVYPQDKTNKIRSHITASGLVFATLSDDAPTFEDYFAGLEPLIDRVDFTRLPYRKSIRYPGNFNWKTMIDGFQECLHCQYTHRAFSKYYPPQLYSVTNHQNFSQHIADPEKPDDGLFLYFFPICTLNVYGGGMSSFRTLPSTRPGESTMEFDYYHSGTDEEFEAYFKFVRQVATEDFELCERAQQNLELGVYAEGVLNPLKENGVEHYQQRVRELIYAFVKGRTEPASRADETSSTHGKAGQVGVEIIDSEVVAEEKQNMGLVDCNNTVAVDGKTIYPVDAVADLVDPSEAVDTPHTLIAV